MFAVQVGLWLLTPVATTEAVTGRLFLEAPVGSWVLSFFLHRRAVHYPSNDGLILLAGRVVEPHFAPPRYWLFVAVSAGGRSRLRALGPYFRPGWFDGGHADGYLVGVVVGAVQQRRRSGGVRGRDGRTRTP